MFSNQIAKNSLVFKTYVPVYKTLQMLMYRKSKTHKIHFAYQIIISGYRKKSVMILFKHIIPAGAYLRGVQDHNGPVPPSFNVFIFFYYQHHHLIFMCHSIILIL